MVVLHDFVLHHLIAGMTVGRGDANGYLDAMQREAGPVGRMLAHGVIDGLLPPVWERHAHEYPLTGEVLSSATGVIVHSAYVERCVREHGYAGPVWRIPLAAWPMPADLPDAGLPPGAGRRELRPPQSGEARAATARRLRFAPRARSRGAAASRRLRRTWTELRSARRRARTSTTCPKTGSGRCWRRRTSASASGTRPWARPRALPFARWKPDGRRSSATSAGSRSYPTRSRSKVPVGDDEVEILAAALDTPRRRCRARASMGAAARALAEQEHDVGRVAEAYAEALEEAAGGEAVSDAVTAAVASAAAEVGLQPGRRGPGRDRRAHCERSVMAAERTLTRRSTWAERVQPLTRNPARAAALALGGLLLVSIAVRIWLSSKIVSPWIMVDEYLYSEMAKSFATSGHFLVRGAPSGINNVVYPALISPAWLAHPMGTTYALAKAINVVVMTATAIPLYLWARRLVAPVLALLAVVLTLLMPAFIYTGHADDRERLPAGVRPRRPSRSRSRSSGRPSCVSWLPSARSCSRSRSASRAWCCWRCSRSRSCSRCCSSSAPSGARSRWQFAWRELRRYWISLRAARRRGAAVRRATGCSRPHARERPRLVPGDRGERLLLRRRPALGRCSTSPSSASPSGSCRLLRSCSCSGSPSSAAERATRPSARFSPSQPRPSRWWSSRSRVFASRFSLRVEDRYMFFLAPLALPRVRVWLDRGVPRPPALLTAVAAGSSCGASVRACRSRPF